MAGYDGGLADRDEGSLSCDQCLVFSSWKNKSCLV